MAREETLRDLVQTFVAKYDVPLRHSNAMAELYRRGAFEPDLQDGADALPKVRGTSITLAERVGAFACRLYVCDVQYQLPDARFALFQSVQDADRLEEQCRKSITTDPFDSYALARWMDAAGRVYYRLGDKTRARLNFERAAVAIGVRITRVPNGGITPDISGTPPDSIAAAWDILSNLLRAEFEEARQQGLPATRLQALAQTLRAFTDMSAKSCAHPVDVNSDAELRRGRVNLVHNTILTLRECFPPPKPPQAEQVPTADARPAWAFTDGLEREISDLLQAADPYRQAQWDLQAVQRAMSLDDSALLRLLNSDWPRGRLIARQHQARIAGAMALKKRENPSRYVQQLLELVNVLDALAERSGARDAADIELRRWTCNFAIDLCKGSAEFPETHRVGKNLRDQVYTARLRIARAVREVTSVAQFKSAYQQRLAPILREASLQKLEDGNIDEFMALLEEAESGEYLDLVAARPQSRQAAGPTEIINAVFAPHSSSSPRAGQRTAPKDGDSIRAAPDFAGTSNLDDARAAILPLRQREEEYWFCNPLPTSQPDPDIHAAAVSETLTDPGLAIIRVAPFSDKSFRAMVYFDGRLAGAPIQIDMEWAKAAVEVIHRQVGQVPSSSVAREMWDNCLGSCFKRCPGARRALIVPAAAFSMLPFQAATVPENFFGVHSSAPLAALLPLSFTTSLTALITRNRKRFRVCRYETTDDMWVLQQIESAANIFQTCVGTRMNCSRVVPATRKALLDVVGSKPEFLVLLVHGFSGLQTTPGGGLRDTETGPFLEFEDGYLTSAGMALTPWLRRNKLTVLGACQSGQPSLERALKDAGGEIPGFVRAFSAAGAGALLLIPWQGLCRQIGMVVGEIFRDLLPQDGKQPEVAQLDELLMKAHRKAMCDYPENGAIENCLFQLWL